MNLIMNLNKNLTRGAVLVAATGLAFFASDAAAQEKGAERLMKLQRLDTPAAVQQVQAGDTVVISCPKCKDIWVKVVQPPGRGGRPESASLQRHECPGCNSKIVTEGVGRQAKTQVVHTCTHCGSQEATCCVMKKTEKTPPATGTHEPHKH